MIHIFEEKGKTKRERAMLEKIERVENLHEEIEPIKIELHRLCREHRIRISKQENLRLTLFDAKRLHHYYGYIHKDNDCTQNIKAKEIKDPLERALNKRLTIVKNEIRENEKLMSRIKDKMPKEIFTSIRDNHREIIEIVNSYT